MTDVAKSLGVSMPTVNSMIKKLSENKLLKYEKYKPLQLTKKGNLDAAMIVRKHRLIEMFLVKFMDFGWEQVHEVAEQMEHINSALFFEKLDKMLGYPQTDPHGSPIPDKNGSMIKLNLVALSKCQPKQTVVLKALLDTSTEFINYLNSKGLALGSRLKIKKIEPFDKTICLVCNKQTLIFTDAVSKKILVEVF